MAVTNHDRVVENTARLLTGIGLQVFRGRRFPQSWSAGGACLVYLAGRTLVSGHGGLDRVDYDVGVRVRLEQRGQEGEERQRLVSEHAARCVSALHDCAFASLALPITSLLAVTVPDGFSVDEVFEDLTDDIEASLTVRWTVFE